MAHGDTRPCTDYYAEASCTAGRANFITGELPIRTGMTTVGQAGATDRHTGTGGDDRRGAERNGLRHWAVRARTTLATKTSFCRRCTASTSSSATCITLDAMEDPAHPAYPQELLNTVGPRNMVHSYATNVDDATVDARWGKVGKQRIEGRGHAISQADGNRGRRNPRPCPEVHRQGQGRQQAVLPVAQPDPHAHRHPSVAEVRSTAQLQERLDHP